MRGVVRLSRIDATEAQEWKFSVVVGETGRTLVSLTTAKVNRGGRS